MTQRIVIADGAADTAPTPARDRRELLRQGLALGGAAAAASSIALLLPVRDASAQDSGDAAILKTAINLEQVTVIAYDTALASGLLSPPALRVARRLRDHEQRHVDTLTMALTDLGGTPPAAARGVAAVDKVVKGLRDAKSQDDLVDFLIELELIVVAAYNEAHAKLVETRLLQTCASITASEGQHLVALRMLRRADPIPNAFETGKP